MSFYEKDNKIIWRNENQLLGIEAWNNNALRIRATMYSQLNHKDWRLDYVKPKKSKYLR